MSFTDLSKASNAEVTRDSIWVTRERKRVAVKDMTDSHLLNLIRVLRCKSPHNTMVTFRDEVRRRQWLNALANEAYSRGLTIEEPDDKDPIHE